MDLFWVVIRIVVDGAIVMFLFVCSGLNLSCFLVFSWWVVFVRLRLVIFGGFCFCFLWVRLSFLLFIGIHLLAFLIISGRSHLFLHCGLFWTKNLTIWSRFFFVWEWCLWINPFFDFGPRWQEYVGCWNY